MITPGPNYVKYTGRPNSARGRTIHITINPHGVLHFSEKAYNEMGKPTGATLWYDEDGRKIAVMPTHIQHGDAFPFTGHAPGARLNVIPFLNDNDIVIDRAQKFLEPEIDENGIAHLDLKRTTTVGRATRKSRNANERARKARS